MTAISDKARITARAHAERTPRLGVQLKINDEPYNFSPGDRPGSFRVARRTRPNETAKPGGGVVAYTVRLHGCDDKHSYVSCTCPDASLGGNRCKHLFAVLRLCCVLAFAGVRKAPPPATALFAVGEGQEANHFVVVKPDDPDVDPPSEDQDSNSNVNYTSSEEAHEQVPAGSGQLEAG